MLDYLIVGGGVAGICFAEQCRIHKKSFLLYHDDQFKSTKVAGGLINPIVLKRFTIVEDAVNQLDYLKPFYNSIETLLNSKLIYDLPVLRKFSSIEEQNDWFSVSDKLALSPFLSTDLIQDIYPSIPAKFGFGKVNHTGYMDTFLFQKMYHHHLFNNHLFFQEHINYDDFIIHEDYVAYQNQKYKNVIFCEGFGLSNNPFFKYLPLDGTKGELLLIHAPDLKFDAILNASIFILPLGNDLYKVGATYNWEEKNENNTIVAREELIEKLTHTINCSFKVVEQFAGVRPTVKDRRPLVGTHHLHKRLHILNGLGTRGVMLGPLLSKKIFKSIEENTEIEMNINIRRFDKKYL